MSGSERILLVNHAHHLVRKSIERRPVFADEKDYAHCVHQIRELAFNHEVGIHAWCLLPDRIHLLASASEDPLRVPRYMKALSCRTALHHNRRYQAEGSPWETHFRSSPVEPGQWLLACMCYIERLPVLAGLCRSAYQYQRSSYRMRLGSGILYWIEDPEEYLELGHTLEERARAYREYMKMGQGAAEIKMIDTAVMRGRLTGSLRFTRKVLREHGVLVINRGPGRPTKGRGPGPSR